MYVLPLTHLEDPTPEMQTVATPSHPHCKPNIYDCCPSDHESQTPSANHTPPVHAAAPPSLSCCSAPGKKETPKQNDLPPLQRTILSPALEAW
jgi:hypothetical protein